MVGTPRASKRARSSTTLYQTDWSKSTHQKESPPVKRARLGASENDIPTRQSCSSVTGTPSKKSLNDLSDLSEDKSGSPGILKVGRGRRNIENGMSAKRRVSFAAEDVSTKRGRGRPPKRGRRRKTDSPATPDDSVDDDHSPGSSQTMEEPVKRGRGRPRKSDTPSPTGNGEIISEHEDTAGSLTPSRGRGRPRKDDTLEVEELITSAEMHRKKRFHRVDSSDSSDDSDFDADGSSTPKPRREKPVRKISEEKKMSSARRVSQRMENSASTSVSAQVSSPSTSRHQLNASTISVENTSKRSSARKSNGATPKKMDKSPGPSKPGRGRPTKTPPGRSPGLREKARKFYGSDSDEEEESELESEDEAESYFHASAHKSKLSGNIMSQFGAALPNTAQIFDTAREEEAEDQMMRGRLLRTLRKESFPKWNRYLMCGFNVLLHGVGSKIQILESFRKEYLVGNNIDHVVIQGFNPAVDMRGVVRLLCDSLGVPTQRDTTSMVADLVKLDRSTNPVTIVFNSLDGEKLRNLAAQEILCSLVESDNFKLIASVDHHQACLLYTQSLVSRYKFVWEHCLTYDHYISEIAYALDGRNSKTLTPQAVYRVLQSLTSHARDIFRILLEYQVKNKEDSKYQGMPFSRLYSQCRNAFLVTSDVNLRAQLVEFRDHQMVKEVASQKSLLVPLGNDVLREILAEMETYSRD